MTSHPRRQLRTHDQRQAHSGAALIWHDGHVLEFDLTWAARRHKLQVADRGFSKHGHQNRSQVQVLVQLRAGVLGEFEQRTQAFPGADVPANIDGRRLPRTDPGNRRRPPG
jgi:hypothetical protein